MLYRCFSGTVFQSLTSCVKLAIGIVPARQVLDTVKLALTSHSKSEVAGSNPVAGESLRSSVVRARKFAQAIVPVQLNFGVGEVLAYFLLKIAVRIRRPAKAG